jgi:hypothetical protein
LLPYEWLFVIPGSIGNDIHASGMDDIRLRRTILPVPGNDILAALGRGKRKAPQNFRSAGLV